jgi:hypothetical protein
MEQDVLSCLPQCLSDIGWKCGFIIFYFHSIHIHWCPPFQWAISAARGIGRINQNQKVFSPIYDPRIIAEIEDMPYFPPIYDATFG